MTAGLPLDGPDIIFKNFVTNNFEVDISTVVLVTHVGEANGKIGRINRNCIGMRGTCKAALDLAEATEVGEWGFMDPTAWTLDLIF